MKAIESHSIFWGDGVLSMRCTHFDTWWENQMPFFFLSCDTWGLPWLVAEWSGLPVIFVFFCTSTTHKMAWMKLSGHDNDSDPASLHCLHGSGAKLVLKVWLHHHDDSQPRLPLQCHHLRTAMDRKQSTCWNRHAGNQFCTTFTQKAQCWHNIFHTKLNLETKYSNSHPQTDEPKKKSGPLHSEPVHSGDWYAASLDAGCLHPGRWRLGFRPTLRISRMRFFRTTGWKKWWTLRREFNPSETVSLLFWKFVYHGLIILAHWHSSECLRKIC